MCPCPNFPLYGEDRTNPSPANPPNGQDKFATYTRDAESGLDYAYQRYFTSGLGRFLTADKKSGSAKPLLPQSWNRYTYALGDPARYNDPTGQGIPSIICRVLGLLCGTVPAARPGPASTPSVTSTITYTGVSTSSDASDPASLDPSTFDDVEIDPLGQQILPAVGQMLNNISVGGFVYADIPVATVNQTVEPTTIAATTAVGGVDSSAGPFLSSIISAGYGDAQVGVETGTSTPASSILFVPIYGLAGVFVQPSGTLGVYVGTPSVGAGIYLNLGSGPPGASGGSSAGGTQTDSKDDDDDDD
jgi:RHS repeat-associated protein